MISDVMHLQLHAARRVDLMHEADRERLIRTFNRPRNRRDPTTSTRRQPISTPIAELKPAP